MKWAGGISTATGPTRSPAGSSFPITAQRNGTTLMSAVTCRPDGLPTWMDMFTICIR